MGHFDAGATSGAENLTLTSVDKLPSPKTLMALQVYFPASRGATSLSRKIERRLLSFTLSLKSGRRGNPSLSQITPGVGAPANRHFNFNPLPSVTTTRPRSLGSTVVTLGVAACRRYINSHHTNIFPVM